MKIMLERGSVPLMLEAPPQYLELRPLLWRALGYPDRHPIIIGIDGRTGQGKTSPASWIAWQLGMSTIHLDIFLVQGAKAERSGDRGAMALTAPAHAQQPGPVPDQMPFDIQYGPSITADHAAQVVAAAVAEAKKSPRNWKLAIAVVDPNGELGYFYKMDGTQTASVQIAQGKARTAACYRRPSEAFFNLMQTPGGAYTATLDPTIVASPGGIVLNEGGKIIGAIGCSGATGAQDAVACKAGADTIK
jgi:uncharacterized protein GlcG (DUF336 family)